ncbi:MAG: hypothetical protein ABH800_00320 [Candidatus Nealsonbacteria bacterium]
MEENKKEKGCPLCDVSEETIKKLKESQKKKDEKKEKDNKN